MNRERLNLVLAAFVVILCAGITIRHSEEAGRSEGGGTKHQLTNHRVTPSETGDGGRRSSRPRGPVAPKSGANDITCEFFMRPAPFQTLSAEGTVTKDALDIAGVDLSKRRAIQSIFNAAFRKAEEGMGKRMVLDSGKTNEARQVYFYRIPSARAEGEEILREMADKLSELVGSRAAMMLMSGFQPFDRFGGFGMCDTEVSLSRTQQSSSGSGDDWWVGSIVTDPISGEVVAKTGSIGSLADRRFGTLFDQMMGKE